MPILTPVYQFRAPENTPPGITPGVVHDQSLVFVFMVVVPGIAGSQIEARHLEKLPYPEYCPSMKSWTEVWLSIGEVLPVFANCLAKDLL